MDVPDISTLPGGPFAAIGGVLGVIAAGAIYFRQYLSGAAAARASDDGQIAALQVYKDLLESATKRQAEAELRADRFAQERNDAVAAVGRLEGQIAALTRQLEIQTQEIAALHEQVRALKEQVHAKA